MKRATAALLGLSFAVATAAACGGDLRHPPLAGGTAGIPIRPVSREMRVQAAYDDTNLYLRVRFPADEGMLERYFHEVDGAWVIEGGGFRDYAAALAGDAERGDPSSVSAHSEVALSVALSARGTPNAVRDFDKYACFTACHDRQRQMPNWRFGDPPSPMALFPGFGGFADVWSWRANRTGLAGFADDEALMISGLVPDAGTSPYTALALGDDGLPPYVFDSAQHGGQAAATWTDVLAGNSIAFDDGTLADLPDALAATNAAWTPAEGDALPAQLLARPTGSRADVHATATWAAGEWDLLLTRKLSTGDAAKDIAFVPGHVYDLGFSLHSDDADGRDHYVSLPVALLVGTAGEGIAATHVSAPPASFADETMFPVSTVDVFLPGVTSFEFVVGAVVNRAGEPRVGDVKHGGASEVSHGEYACAECHTVRAGLPRPSYRDAGSFETLVLRRGGVFDATPFAEAP